MIRNDNLAKIEADRTELFRREAAGEVIAPEAWIALGDRQAALTAAGTNRQGYMVGPDWA